MMVSICCKSYNRRVMICLTTIIMDGVAVDLFPEEWCQSYKLHYLRRGKLSDDCRIVAFHGRPKPHEVNDFWVKENWR